MRKSPFSSLALSCAAVPLVLFLPVADASAQSPKTGKLTTSPTAITGLASSAKHCVSGTSANVHAIGWIERGSVVTVTFRSDFDPIAGIVMLAVDTPEGRGGYLIDDDSGGNLDPAMSYTATFSGNAALYVSGYRSTSGCYWYKLEVVPPSQSATELVPSVAAPPKTAAFRPAAITGAPSISYHCIAGDGVTNIHALGRVSGGRVIVTFDTDFDAIAGIVNMDLLAANPTPRYALDDDSGGRLAPELRFNVTEPGTLALFVGGYQSVAGCYRFKVEIQ